MDTHYLKPESLQILVNLEEVCDLLPDFEDKIRMVFARGAAGELDLEFIPEHLDIGYELGTLFYSLEGAHQDSAREERNQVITFYENEIEPNFPRFVDAPWSTKKRLYGLSRTLNSLTTGRTRAESTYDYLQAFKVQLHDNIYEGDWKQYARTLEDMTYTLHFMAMTANCQNIMGVYHPVTEQVLDREYAFLHKHDQLGLEAQQSGAEAKRIQLETAVANEHYEVAARLRDQNL